MSAARYHRRTDDDTAISSMNSTNCSKYYCTTLLFVVDTHLRKYFYTPPLFVVDTILIEYYPSQI